jgi:hypothetical protein
MVNNLILTKTNVMLTTPELESSNQQNRPTNVVILLTVKASNLFAISNPSQSDIAKFTQLFDGIVTSPFGESKVNYTTEVFLNHDVDWKATVFDPQGADKNFEVKVTAYKHKNEPTSKRFFSQDRIGRSNGKVEGRILDDPNLRDTNDIYGIEFDISHERLGTKKISMDPKLKIKPQQ